MAIIALQRRIREVGRIRLGIQTEKDGKTFPRKLNRFRFTSPDRTVIEACAALCGGTVEAWRNGESDEWEVITNAKEIRILIPPGDMAFSQFYEQWAKGFCTARCDGEWNTVRDMACTCDPDDRTCRATTRLSVILPDIPGLGVWRVESHGYYAAVELGAAVELIGQLVGRAMIPARLRLDQRELRRLERGKAVVRKIVVPVIDIDVSVTQVQALGAAPVTPALPALPAAGESDWQPVPPAEPPANPPSLEDQLAEVDQAPAKPARKNAAAPLKATGRKPRTAAERKRDDAGAVDVGEHCPVCDQPITGEPVIVNRDRLAGPDGSVPRYLHRRCHDGPAATGGGGDSGARVEPAESPPSAAEEPDGDDEAEGDDPPPPGAIGPPTKPTAKMHSKIFALLAETLPVEVGVPGADADAQRQQYEYALSDALGEPITSHKDLSFEGGRNLIDALEGIKNGVYGWDVKAERLVHADTGAFVIPTEEEEPF